MRAIENLILGVDGGGTKMRGCLLRADGEVLAVKNTPPASFAELRGGIAMPILQLSQALCSEAQAAGAAITMAGICFTGVGRAADREIVARALERLDLAEKIVVESDAMAALVGAFAGEPGVIVSAGTGAVAYARLDSGEFIRVGGWGYLLGDEGSGYALARNAINAALQAWDGRGEETLLRQSLEQHFVLSSIDLILSQIYAPGFDRGQMAALAPLVFAAADAGDAVAQNLVRDTGFELGRLALAAVRKFHAPAAVPLALLGNLFIRADWLMPSFWEVLQEEKSRVQIVEPRFEPAVGAALLALHSTGRRPEVDFLAKLEATSKKWRQREG